MGSPSVWKPCMSISSRRATALLLSGVPCKDAEVEKLNTLTCNWYGRALVTVYYRINPNVFFQTHVCHLCTRHRHSSTVEGRSNSKMPCRVFTHSTSQNTVLKNALNTDPITFPFAVVIAHGSNTYTRRALCKSHLDAAYMFYPMVQIAAVACDFWKPSVARVRGTCSLHREAWSEWHE